MAATEFRAIWGIEATFPDFAQKVNHTNKCSSNFILFKSYNFKESDPTVFNKEFVRYIWRIFAALEHLHFYAKIATKEG